MMVVVCYDVSTETPEGRRRLSHIAKICKNYGQRVQKSVFECTVEPAQWTALRYQLLNEANLKEDNLRFYFLGANWQKRIEYHGAKVFFDFEGTLIV
jgi:CRISPR-associated protein Cas2